MSAEEKKYVYPEVEEDYEDNDDSDKRVELKFDTDKKEENTFRLVDLKDEVTFAERVDAETMGDVVNRRIQYCPYCGGFISTNATHCTKCGNRLPDEERDGRWVNKWISFLLCFFGGVVGAHKFYEGKIGMGILYIFTGGLFGIGALVDLISILLKDNPYYVVKK